MSDLRTESAMGAAAGDTGTVVAMFETYDRALAARDALVSAGIDRSRIEILAQSGSLQDTSFHYAEGIRRGELSPNFGDGVKDQAAAWA
jgi:hypothetical protein